MNSASISRATARSVHRQGFLYAGPQVTGGCYSKVYLDSAFSPSQKGLEVCGHG